MTAEEVKSIIDEQRAQGSSDEQILDALYQMFLDGKINKEDLGKVIGVLGYEFTPEFAQDETADPSQASEQGQGGEEITQSEIEDAKEAEPGETETETESETETETEDNDEDGEKQEAKKLFGLN